MTCTIGNFVASFRHPSKENIGEYLLPKSYFMYPIIEVEIFDFSIYKIVTVLLSTSKICILIIT